MTRLAHCAYCGQRFPEAAPWPRTCAGCGETSYLNPIPVTVVLVPIAAGLLAVRRAIEPGRGQLALPGGFVNAGESWQVAGAREVAEETGLALDPAELTVFAVHSPPAPVNNVLIFALAQPRRAAELDAFTPNAETHAVVVLAGPQPLAFPLHTRVAAEYFARQAAAGR